MASVGNRQNLHPTEAANAIEIYNSAGRLDPGKTKAANDVIFHSSNGNVAKDSVATVAAKQKAARDKIYSDNR